MRKKYGKMYELYMYIIPTMAIILYIAWLVLSYKTSLNIKLLHESKGFEELCKALLNYTSILLGVYGFFVPVIIGKMDEDFSKKFWNMINRDKFAKDNHRIFLAGIITILLSAVLLLKDIMNVWVTNVLVVLMIWNVVFFSCSTYRFIGIFIKLIIGEKKKDSKGKYQMTDQITESQKANLDEKIGKF